MRRSKENLRIVNSLDSEVRESIEIIRSQIKPIHGTEDKFRHIFKDSFLEGEWINTSDMQLITGFGLTRVHSGLAGLAGLGEIKGQRIPLVEYYEMLRPRHDRAAKLLLAVASMRMDCPEDEVSLAALTMPDVPILANDLRGTVVGMQQAGGFYFTKYTPPGEAGDIPDEIPIVGLDIDQPVLV